MLKVVTLGFAALLSMPFGHHAPSHSPSSTLYVNAQLGTDSASGSKAQPYQTISYAIKEAKSGATIVVEPGNYHDSLSITKQVHIKGKGNVVLDESQAAEGIVIEGAKAEGTTVSGLTIENPLDHGIYVQDTNHITIDHNTITGAVRGNAGIAEDKPLELVGVSNSVVSKNSVVNNNSDGGIGLSDDGIVNPGDVKSGAPLPARNNVIKDNVIDNNQKGCGIVVAAYDSGEGVSHNRVIGNTVTRGVAGIVIAADVPNSSASDNLVEGNTLENNGLPGVIVHSNTPGDVVKGTQILNNTISGNGFFHSPEMGTVNTHPIMDGIAVIGNVTPPTQTVISNNKISNEQFGIGYSNNVTGSIVITPSNTFDSTVGTPTVEVTLD